MQNTIEVTAAEAKSMAERVIKAIELQRNKEWESAIAETMRKGFFRLFKYSRKQAINKLKSGRFISVYDEIFYFSYGRIYNEAKEILNSTITFPKVKMSLTAHTVSCFKSWIDE